MRDFRLQRQLQTRRSARRQMLIYLKERDCLVLAKCGDHQLFVDPADNYVTEHARLHNSKLGGLTLPNRASRCSDLACVSVKRTKDTIGKADLK